MKINKCRSCKSSGLLSTFSLGNQYLTGVFPKKKNEKISKGNLSLVFFKSLLIDCKKTLESSFSFYCYTSIIETFCIMTSPTQSKSWT